jgi:hypothetical protein
MAGSPANTRAMRAIGQLCQDAGLRVVEAAGWTDRGRTWAILKPEWVVAHHTAAAIDIDRVLIDGRADLPGPLCNFALHADDTVVLIASGTANHAGVATISSAAAYGIEATGPIPAGASGPSAFPNYDAYVVLCAAIRLHHGWPVNRVVAHKEIARPDGRKPDPMFGDGYPAPYLDMDRFRAAVDAKVKAWGLPVQEEEDPLPFTRDEIKAMLREVLNEGTAGGQSTWAGTSKSTLGTIQQVYNKANATDIRTAAMATRVEAIEGDVDTLVAGLAPPAEPTP